MKKETFLICLLFTSFLYNIVEASENQLNEDEMVSKSYLREMVVIDKEKNKITEEYKQSLLRAYKQAWKQGANTIGSNVDSGTTTETSPSDDFTAYCDYIKEKLDEMLDQFHSECTDITDNAIAAMRKSTAQLTTQYKDKSIYNNIISMQALSEMSQNSNNEEPK